jgi:hypothetical protein
MSDEITRAHKFPQVVIVSFPDQLRQAIHGSFKIHAGRVNGKVICAAASI